MNDSINTVVTETASQPDNIALTLRYIGGAIGVITGLYKGISFLYKGYVTNKTSNDLHPYFSKLEVKNATKYFVDTKVQNIPPSKERELGQIYDFITREKLIPFFIKKGFKNDQDDQRFYLILADSGMGKTTFMINLFAQYNSVFNFNKTYKIYLMPFKDSRTLEKIKEICGNSEEVKKSILLLDAFDEDEEAVLDYRKRLDEVMQQVRDFREVVITSRTQFFKAQEDEPDEIKIPKFGPEGGFHRFRKMYVSPFEDADIKKYLNKKFGRFPLWNRAKKKKAQVIVKQSPNLMVRPMLLSYVEDLLEDKTRKFEFTYQIYEALIEKWLEREAVRIPEKEKRPQFKKELYTFSQNFALLLFEEWKNGNDKLEVSRDTLLPLADKHSLTLTDFQITGRSLLTRNTAREWKFAHKSFMEYFLAKEMMQNDLLALDITNNDGMDQARKFYEEMGGKSIYPRIKMIGVEYNMNGNRKQNDVIANDFLIGKYPVTQKIWKTVMGNNPSKFKGCDNCPVESVSWYDAVEFCNKLSELHGLSKFYSIDKDRVDPNNKSEKDKKKWMIRTNENANGYRLPTETEWEFAARGGKLSKGYTYAGSNNLDEVGWYNKNSNKNIHPVGELKPNELGIYDMSGNVFEWCWDWYGEYNKADKDNPLGAESGNHRVVRGGSRNYYNINCRVAFRYFDNPDYRYFNLGFRLTRALHSNTFNERELAGE